MSSKQETVSDQFSKSWVRKHVDLVLELPEPGQTYRAEDVVREPEKFPTVRDDIPLAFRHSFNKLRENHVIRQQEYFYNSEESNGYYLWRTDRESYELAKRVREDQETYPCGHSSGFRTIEAQQTYECLYEYCGEEPERFGPEEVRRVEF